MQASGLRGEGLWWCCKRSCGRYGHCWQGLQCTRESDGERLLVSTRLLCLADCAARGTDALGPLMAEDGGPAPRKEKKDAALCAKEAVGERAKVVFKPGLKTEAAQRHCGCCAAPRRKAGAASQGAGEREDARRGPAVRRSGHLGAPFF